MNEKRIVVIGHKDHGKSTLIGRLLYDAGQIKPDRIEEVRSYSLKNGFGGMNYAFFLDTFQEEREGGLTIDIAYSRLKDGAGDIVLIDCPGHRELIKNMLTGASASDAALLAVSAAPGEGISPQTEDHVRIARAVGVRRLVVAVTKMDTVGGDRERYREVVGPVERLLEETGYDPAGTVFIPVSSIDGAGVTGAGPAVSWYRGPALLDALASVAAVRPDRSSLPLRVPVQDVYDIDGVRVVVGRVESGTLKAGDAVRFLPSGGEGTVARLFRADMPCEEVGPDENAGVVLAEGNAPLPGRGEVVCRAEGAPVPVDSVSSVLVMIADDRTLRQGDRVSLYCGTAAAAGTVETVSGDHPFLNATLRLESPVVAERYADDPFLGRFAVYQVGACVGVGILS